tara:strand:- start:376813 stop:377718 length:906 start_codon:yes stop_codon:yes gene_type:complete
MINPSHIRLVFALITGLSWSTFAMGQSEKQDEQIDQRSPAILLADDSVHPTMTVRWTTNHGQREVTGPMTYGPPLGGEILQGDTKDEAGNVRAYLALGGSRVDTGAGHPNGIVIRTGLTKVDSAKPFFEDIKAGGMIEIEIEGVKLNQPIKYHQGTGIMHLKYAIGDLLACSLPGTARNQYLLSDPKDTLGGRVVAGVNATPGALSGDSEWGGSFDVTVDEDDPTRMGFVVRVPFGLLRHLQDPWESTLPNTFFEPIHLHAEAELLQIWATPFDREWIVESNEPAKEEVIDSVDDAVESDG